MVKLELFQSQKNKGQTSFEFILVLTLTIMLIGVFMLAATEEYTDTFVLTAVKNAVEHETAYVSLSQPECTGTFLKWMNFSKESNLISVNISGCPLNLVKVAGKVETQVCGASRPTGGSTMVCSGEIYTLREV